jgi:hypothetical protein
MNKTNGKVKKYRKSIVLNNNSEYIKNTETTKNKNNIEIVNNIKAVNNKRAVNNIISSKYTKNKNNIDNTNNEDPVNRLQKLENKLNRERNVKINKNRYNSKKNNVRFVDSSNNVIKYIEFKNNNKNNRKNNQKNENTSNKPELFCSPNKKNSKLTCYRKKDLVLLASSFNSNNKMNRYIPTNLSKVELWKKLNQEMKTCKYEWCWLKKAINDHKQVQQISNRTFRPVKPANWNKNKYEWLSNFDIENVMKQYEKKHKNFLFVGPVPSDCPTSYKCILSVIEPHILYNDHKKNKLGIIYNLDKHNEPGSHWVSIYADFLNGYVYYFDSVGSPPPRSIFNYLKTLTKKIDQISVRPAKLMINRTQYQFGNTECGIFSMFFIIANLNNPYIGDIRKYLSQNKDNINDDTMNELRNKLFRPDE